MPTVRKFYNCSLFHFYVLHEVNIPLCIVMQVDLPYRLNKRFDSILSDPIGFDSIDSILVTKFQRLCIRKIVPHFTTHYHNCASLKTTAKPRCYHGFGFMRICDHKIQVRKEDGQVQKGLSGWWAESDIRATGRNGSQHPRREEPFRFGDGQTQNSFRYIFTAFMHQHEFAFANHIIRSCACIRNCLSACIFVCWFRLNHWKFGCKIFSLPSFSEAGAPHL